jgi:hypothetical protein
MAQQKRGLKALMASADKQREKLEREKDRLFSHASVKVPEQIAQEAYGQILNLFVDPMKLMNGFKVTQENLDNYLTNVFQEMFTRLKVEGKINDVFALLAIQSPESLTKDISLEEKRPIDYSMERMCKYVARFLEDEERTELFQLLLSLLTGSSELRLPSIFTDRSETSPEKKIAEIVGVSNRVVFKWKQKQTIPSPENTAKILLELLRRDPGRVNPRLNSILRTVGKEAIKTYNSLNEFNAEQSTL